jgi:hypothetical protein
LVAEAGIAAADTVPDGPPQAYNLLKLADVLVRAESIEAGRTMLMHAKSRLGLFGPIDRLTQGKLVERVAQIGDTSAAQALLSTTATSEIQAELLGYLGVGLARARDQEGARKTAEAIAALPDDGGAVANLYQAAMRSRMRWRV